MNIFRLLLLLFFVGCSIKEERGDCPSRLIIDLTNVDILDQSPLSLCLISDDGSVEYRTELNPKNYSDKYIFYVHGTNLSVVIWSGGEELLNDKGLTIPLGSDCPPVYIHSRAIDAESEIIYDTVYMRKNFCVLSIGFIGVTDVKSLVVRGEIQGFDRIGNPCPGEFRVCSDLSSDGEHLDYFCIPRQNGNMLFLDVTEPDGVVKTFPIHEYLSEFGYDWTESDLSDLNMLLEYTTEGATVTIQSWDEEIVFNVVI